MILRALIAHAAMAGVAAFSAHQAQAQETCEVSDVHRDEARQLEWFDFDQVSSAPGSFRVLANAGCHAEAIDAYTDWLEHGPGFPNQRSRAIGTFHRGQLHAMLGQNGTAQELMQQAYRTVGEDDPQAAPWNAYLDGVLAWFEDDAARIRSAVSRLEDYDTPFAVRQTGVLQGLINCLHSSYAQAMSPACQNPESDQAG